MKLDVVQLTKDLVAIRSVSLRSNVAVSDFLEQKFRQGGFAVERLEYVDVNGERKFNLVAQKGEGPGGLAFFSHSDTVPGQELEWAAFDPVVEKGRLIGRGSCDMKGPLAATMVAALGCKATQLRKPVFVVVTADEEVGMFGAKQIAAESKLLAQARPLYGVVAEPTRLVPVYAHKGFGLVTVTATGRAAHSSTDLGLSANFLIAPFLADMAELAARVKNDKTYMNHEFTPPTPGLNMVVDDGGCRPNVTAAKTVCTLSFRPAPNDRSQELISAIMDRATAYGLEAKTTFFEPFYTAPDAEIVQIASRVTGDQKPRTVPYGTDAFFLQRLCELVVLGPGDIAQAHTVGEWVEVAQLEQAVEVYRTMIEAICT
jgi:acetylornithine deacetylase